MILQVTQITKKRGSRNDEYYEVRVETTLDDGTPFSVVLSINTPTSDTIMRAFMSTYGDVIQKNRLIDTLNNELREMKI